jgi:purine nucleosidase
VASPTPVPVILDTDLGTDVDDCLALALVLRCAELELVAVTCVSGDVELRARMAERLLELHGRPRRPPVLRGAGESLLGLRSPLWLGHEGEGLVPSDAGPSGPRTGAPHAATFIVDTVLRAPGRVHLVAIGPLTNVALALRQDPRVAPALGGLTLMGGAIRGPGRLDLPYAEHNIRSDPEAAHIVFASGAPVTMVPLDVTTEVRLTPAGVARIRGAGTPFHAALADQVERYPRYRERGYTFMHDPLAVAAVVRPDLLGTEDLHIDVELGGRLTTGMTLARPPRDPGETRARVALRVDAAGFEEFFHDRVTGAR